MSSTIDATLKQISRLSEETNARELAQRLGVAYEMLDTYPFNVEALKMVPLKTVETKQYAAYLRTANRVRVAVVHPENKEVIEDLVALGKEWKRTLEITVVSNTSMTMLVRSYVQLLQEEATSVEQHAAQMHRAKEENYFAKVQSISDLQREAIGAGTTRLLDAIFGAAVGSGASDIHFEPGEHVLTVRFRIDGVLQKVVEVAITHLQPIVSRIKMLASIKLDEQTKSQDGRFSLAELGAAVDIRVSTIPTGYGEGIVMRLLRQDMRALNLSELGFSEHNLKLIHEVIQKPYGLILVTGPTGSGKSTTLYALLQLLNTPDRKIITLEDPIEYKMDGLQQSQIDTAHGFTFAEGLRGALRQDPDIVMVGEIRDAETATIALNASLTGHLVLSTLHTNNAVTAHTRFLEMGIPPFLLAGSIQMVIAQRLVRRYKKGSDPKNNQFEGRVVVAEVLCPTHDFEQAVTQGVDQFTLENIAEKGGMIPISKDGLAKIAAGISSEEEVRRVVSV